jgi:hypothetical protein
MTDSHISCGMNAFEEAEQLNVFVAPPDCSNFVVAFRHSAVAQMDRAGFLKPRFPASAACFQRLNFQCVWDKSGQEN